MAAKVMAMEKWNTVSMQLYFCWGRAELKTQVGSGVTCETENF